MKIGNRLKNIRKFLGLTQLEFSGNIVTESFYSRVENGKSDISISKLIELLNYNHISLYEFFEPAFQGNIEQQIILAFLDKDSERLRKYQPQNDQEKAIRNLLLEILGGKSGHCQLSPEEFSKRIS